MTVKKAGQHWVIEDHADNPPGTENLSFDTQAEAVDFDLHLEGWRALKQRLRARPEGSSTFVLYTDKERP
jgi:hypothetical protein